MDQNPAIIIDNGSYQLRAGFAGHDTPECISIAVGGPSEYGIEICFCKKDETIYQQEQLKYPMKRGIINDYSDMEKIWRRVFKELNIKKPENNPVLLTETSMNPKEKREWMTKMFLYGFEAPKFSVVNQAVLSLYASGRTTGIVLQSGDGVSETVPIYEGFALKHAVLSSNFTGSVCTEYLANLVKFQGFSIKPSIEMQIIREIKQKFCYIALDYQQELLKQNHCYKSYELPDERTVFITNERFQCPEIIFNPHIQPANGIPGIPQVLNNSIQECDIDLRRELYSNIVLSGGNTLFPGYFERLTKELTPLAPNNMKIQLDAPPQRELSVWFGGSILSQLSTFQAQQITREEFEEYGRQLVHRKCF